MLKPKLYTLATWCEEPTHWKRPYCWHRMKEGEGDGRGWDDWMASPTQCTGVWANSVKWWRIGQPGLLQSMGLRIVEYDRVTEQQQGKPDIKLRNSILGKSNNLGLLKSFHSKASQLCRASSCCIFLSLTFCHLCLPAPRQSLWGGKASAGS